MSDFNTIWEDFELPSKGMIYDKPVNPKISLRSMTTLEEMKRLSPSDTPYKVMSDIIEGCMKEKPDIHVHDMCEGDYQFLLHKLRIVTYGPEYKMFVTCPNCKETTESIADLESLEVNTWTPDITKDMLIVLPKTNKEIELRFQTPRDLDTIVYRDKEMKKKTKQNVDYSLLFTVMSVIKKVDGRVLTDMQLQEFVKELPLKDVNFILNKASELNNKVGLNTEIVAKCSLCGAEVKSNFRSSREFFGPTNY